MSTERDGRAGITIAIVDDEQVVHAGIGAWLTGTQPAMTVVAGFTENVDPDRIKAEVAALDIPVQLLRKSPGVVLKVSGEGIEGGGSCWQVIER